MSKKTYHEIRIEKVSFKTGIEECIVEDIFSEFCKYVKSKIEENNMESGVLLEEGIFTEKTTIVKIPHIGHLVPSYSKHKIISKRKQLKTQNFKKETNGKF